MASNYFNFKQFTINQERSAFKVGTDGVLLGAYADVSGAKRILDIGTGTGLIALMLAQRCDAEIVAIEPDHESFLQSCENINNSMWADRIRVVESALQDFIDDGKFDLIVTNPPYFSDSIRNPDNRKAAARHNDTLTSDDILKSCSGLLSDEGRLQLIMPFAEGNVLLAEAADYGLFCHDILRIKPLPTSEIRRLIMAFGRERFRPTEKFLTIEYGKRHEFTDEYINLTKEFYLKF
ncbi:MAG: methyltransferase [Bacteroidetes bacterium]|nr:methyltransferase [Bacteroidota bacterium]